MGPWLLPSPNNMACHCQAWAVNSVVLNLPKDPNFPGVCAENPQGIDCNGGWSTPADSHRPAYKVKTMVSHLSIPPHPEMSLQALLQWPRMITSKELNSVGIFSEVPMQDTNLCSYYFKKRTAVFVCCCSYFSETQSLLRDEKYSWPHQPQRQDLKSSEFWAHHEGRRRRLGGLSWTHQAELFSNALCLETINLRSYNRF